MSFKHPFAVHKAAYSSLDAAGSQMECNVQTPTSFKPKITPTLVLPESIDIKHHGSLSARDRSLVIGDETEGLTYTYHSALFSDEYEHYPTLGAGLGSAWAAPRFRPPAPVVSWSL